MWFDSLLISSKLVEGLEMVYESGSADRQVLGFPCISVCATRGPEEGALHAWSPTVSYGTMCTAAKLLPLLTPNLNSLLQFNCSLIYLHCYTEGNLLVLHADWEYTGGKAFPCSSLGFVLGFEAEEVIF